MRLIDADVLKEKAKWYNIYSDKPPHSIRAVTTQEIDWMPTVFLEPKIIRCKDCTYRNGDYCHRFHDGYSAFIHLDDFCSYAERREGAKQK